MLVRASLYDNADITRYYLGPLLIVVTWLAILADGLRGCRGRAPRQRPGRAAVGGDRGLRRPGCSPSRSLLAVALVGPGRAGRRGDPRGSSTRAATRPPQHWIDATLAALEPNAVVISWWSFSTPLWYARDVEGRRPDITIIDDRTSLDENLGDVPDVIDAYLGKRPVYVIRLQADMATLAERYELLPVPDLIACRPRRWSVGRRTVTP